MNVQKIRGISLDATVGGDEDKALAEILDLSGNQLFSGASWRLNPEEALIAREERAERNRYRRGRRESDLLWKWLRYLPQKPRQVLRARWLSDPRFVRGYTTIVGEVGARDGGLKITVEEAQRYEAEGIEVLRAFARGDFSRADYREVVKALPEMVVQSYHDEVLQDDLEKFVLRYTLLKKREIKTTSGHIVTGALPLASIVTRKHKALNARAGRDLTREEARTELERLWANVCKRLAEQVGLALE